MTALSLSARFIDLKKPDGREIVATIIGRIISWSRHKGKDGDGNIKIEFSLHTKMAKACVDCFGGSTYDSKKVKQYMLEISRDGGVNWIDAMIVEAVTITLGGSNKGIVIDGKDLFNGFNRTFISTLNFDGTKVKDVIHGAPGTIPIVTGQAGSTGVILVSTTFPYLRGLDSSNMVRGTLPQVNRTTFTFQADPAVADLPVSVASLEDTVANTLRTVMRAAGGFYNPLDTAPLGARTHYSVDVGARTVKCGYVGTTSKCKFTNRGKKSDINQRTTAWIETDKVQIRPNNEMMKAQSGFRGGQSNHGLPPGAEITGLVVANTNFGPTSVAWNANLCYAGVRGSNDTGGVGYWPHDGYFHFLGQSMKVNDLTYDAALNLLIAATKRGLFARTADTGSGGNFVKLGKAGIEFTKVWTDGSGVYYALATGNGSTGDGLFRYPQIAGESPTVVDNLGYGGMTRYIYGGNVFDASGTDAVLYTVDSADPTTIFKHTSGVSAAHPIDVPNGAGVVGLDFGENTQRTYVRTTDGALGIYYLEPDDTTPHPLDDFAAPTLKDNIGALQVNQVVEYNGTITGNFVAIVIVTDRGVYFTSSLAGGSWKSATALSGLVDLNIAQVAIGAAQMIISSDVTVGRSFTPFYGFAGGRFLVSRSDAVWFRDETAQPLHKGPFWSALYAQIYGGFADNTVTGLGTLGAGIDPGTSGITKAIPSTNRRYLPTNWVWGRHVDNQNMWDYRLVFADSNAPYNCYMPAELSEMTADDNRGVITAAEQLAVEEWRFMSEASQVPFSIALPTKVSRADAAALNLNYADAVTVDLVYSVLTEDTNETYDVINFVDVLMYVLDIQEDKEGAGMDLVVTVGNSLALCDLTLPELVAGTADGISKDRRFRRVA